MKRGSIPPHMWGGMTGQTQHSSERAPRPWQWPPCLPSTASGRRAGARLAPALPPARAGPAPARGLATLPSQATRVLRSPAHLLPRALISCKCKNSGQTPPKAEPPSRRKPINNLARAAWPGHETFSRTHHEAAPRTALPGRYSDSHRHGDILACAPEGTPFAILPSHPSPPPNKCPPPIGPQVAND